MGRLVHSLPIISFSSGETGEGQQGSLASLNMRSVPLLTDTEKIPLESATHLQRCKNESADLVLHP